MYAEPWNPPNFQKPWASNLRVSPGTKNIIASGFKADTDYFLALRAVDEAGNEDSNSKLVRVHTATYLPYNDPNPQNGVQIIADKSIDDFQDGDLFSNQEISCGEWSSIPESSKTNLEVKEDSTGNKYLHASDFFRYYWYSFSLTSRQDCGVKIPKDAEYLNLKIRGSEKVKYIYTNFQDMGDLFRRVVYDPGFQCHVARVLSPTDFIDIRIKFTPLEERNSPNDIPGFTNWKMAFWPLWDAYDRRDIQDSSASIDIDDLLFTRELPVASQ